MFGSWRKKEVNFKVGDRVLYVRNSRNNYCTFKKVSVCSIVGFPYGECVSLSGSYKTGGKIIQIVYLDDIILIPKWILKLKKLLSKR